MGFCGERAERADTPVCSYSRDGCGGHGERVAKREVVLRLYSSACGLVLGSDSDMAFKSFNSWRSPWSKSGEYACDGGVSQASSWPSLGETQWSTNCPKDDNPLRRGDATWSPYTL